MGQQMNINDIAERAYNNAIRLGKIGTRSTVDKLGDIHSEYLEALKALNCRDFCDIEILEITINKYPDLFKESFKVNIHNTYEDELTDLLFVVLTLMKDKKMNIKKHIEFKMKYNELRDDHK